MYDTLFASEGRSVDVRYLDLANSDHYNSYLNSVGGLDILRKYPKMLALIEYSKEQHLERRQTKNHATNNAIQFGYSDIDSPLNVNYNNVTEVSASLLSSTNAINALIIHTFELYDVSDEKRPIRLTGNSFVQQNTDEFHSTLKYDSSRLPPGQIRKFRMAGQIQRVITNEHGHSEMVPILVSGTYVKEFQQQPIVTAMNVEDPTPKRTGGDKTVILYNRAGMIADPYDYAYEDVLVSPDNVAIHIPCKGKVTLLDGFTPRGIVLNIGTDTRKFDLFIRNKTGPIPSHCSLSETQVIISGQELEWKFPDKWNNQLPKADFDAGNNNASVHCHLAMSIRAVIQGGMEVEIPITASSYNQDANDTANAVLKKIYIKWGCFCEGTRIQMSNGSEKNIQDIRVGDEIANTNGTACAVRNVYCGNETRVILVRTSSGKEIMVSESHPLMTTNP